MFDSICKIFPKSKWDKIYLVSRIFLYLLFLLGSLFIVYKILFPEVPLTYTFASANAIKNTIFSVRTTTKDSLKNGLITNKEKLFFNANPMGTFENATLQIINNKKSNPVAETSVKVRKSYAAFFYPEGQPVGLPDGALLSTNGNYYIVSDGKVRQFVSGAALDQLGFSRSSFARISPEDLQLSPKGENILNANTYPDDTLFVVNNQYYQFKNQKLFLFLSEKAFLSRFQPIQAIPKNEDFLKDKTVAEDSIGFADGTLASSDQSVFILSQGLSYPVADADTFMAMGFDWNVVLPLSTSELGAYKKQKQFTVNQPHPDGTVFFDKQTKESFVIEKGFKRPIKNKLAFETFSKISPVLVDSQSLAKEISCKLTKTSLDIFRTSQCELALAEIKDFPGNDYQFELAFPNDVNLNSASVIFYTKFSQASTLTSLSLIKNRLQNNYVKN